MVMCELLWLGDAVVRAGIAGWYGLRTAWLLLHCYVWVLEGCKSSDSEVSTCPADSNL